MSWPEGGKNRRARAAEVQLCGECCCWGWGTGSHPGLSAAPGNPRTCTGTGICLPAHTRAPSQGMETGHLGNIWQCGQGFPELLKVWVLSWSVNSSKSSWNKMIPQMSSACRKQTWTSCNILTQIPVLPSHLQAYPVQGVPVLNSCTLKNVLLITEIGFCAIQSLCKWDPFGNTARQVWGLLSLLCFCNIRTFIWHLFSRATPLASLL